MRAPYITFLLSPPPPCRRLHHHAKPPPPKLVQGGRTLIKNLSDPHVIEAARFAVKEHKQDKADMVRLLRVLKGWTQVIAGINYRLILAARPVVHRRHVVHHYEALVYERPSEHFMNLTSFKPLIEH